MKRADIIRDYQPDNRGIIQRPGKFEGEMLYVPYLWFEGIMNGAGIPLPTNKFMERVLIEDKDRLEFPELIGVKAAILWEDEQGFVRCRVER